MGDLFPCRTLGNEQKGPFDPTLWPITWIHCDELLQFQLA